MWFLFPRDRRLWSFNKVHWSGWRPKMLSVSIFPRGIMMPIRGLNPDFPYQLFSTFNLQWIYLTEIYTRVSICLVKITGQIGSGLVQTWTNHIGDTYFRIWPRTQMARIFQCTNNKNEVFFFSIAHNVLKRSELSLFSFQICLMQRMLKCAVAS